MQNINFFFCFYGILINYFQTLKRKKSFQYPVKMLGMHLKCDAQEKIDEKNLQTKPFLRNDQKNERRY